MSDAVREREGGRQRMLFVAVAMEVYIYAPHIEQCGPCGDEIGPSIFVGPGIEWIERGTAK